jgi:hypothetical protein
LAGEGLLLISNTTFHRNRAGQGGGLTIIYHPFTGAQLPAQLSYSSFVNNTAQVRGGGMKPTKRAW